MLKQITTFPGQLFLIDGMGALLSAVLLGMVLPNFEQLLGIPLLLLYFLATIPIVFFIYDMICYFFIKQNHWPYIRFIAYANMVYCAISLLLCTYHLDRLTIYGWGYIVIEIAVIMLLVTLELKTVASLKI